MSFKKKPEKNVKFGTFFKYYSIFFFKKPRIKIKITNKKCLCNSFIFIPFFFFQKFFKKLNLSVISKFLGNKNQNLSKQQKLFNLKNRRREKFFLHQKNNKIFEKFFFLNFYRWKSRLYNKKSSFFILSKIKYLGNNGNAKDLKKNTNKNLKCSFPIISNLCFVLETFQTFSFYTKSFFLIQFPLILIPIPFFYFETNKNPFCF